MAKVFEKELEKLDILNPQSPDYSVQLNYLQTYVSLPWGEYTQDDLDLKRAGITDILMCADNRKDIEEIPAMYLEGVNFHYVENIQDVWDYALLDEKVANAVHFDIEEDKKEK